MNLDEFSKEQLWQLLIDAVHASVMYPSRKAYTRDTILKENVDVSPRELAQRLGMTFGEALVILTELRPETKSAT